MQDRLSPAGAGGFYAAVGTALVVEAFQAGFVRLVDALVTFQNHRTLAGSQWHRVTQGFALLFVNRFFSPLYLTFLKHITPSVHLYWPVNDMYEEVCVSRDGDPTEGCVPIRKVAPDHV